VTYSTLPDCIREGDALEEGSRSVCLTTPGRIVRIDGDDPEMRTATVDFGVAVRPALLVYTPDAKVGDFVIVHAGFATRRLGEVEAEEALAYLAEMKRLGEEAPPAPPASIGAEGST
jgi:hydrogenase expression/formation protein HypC